MTTVSKRLIWGGALLAVLASLWAVTLLTDILQDHGVFEVSLDMSNQDFGLVLENVTVEGGMRTPRGAVIAKLDADRGTPILGIDLQQLQSRIEELSWVKKARVKRVLPSSLQVRLTEFEPMALWQKQGTLRLISTDGAIIPVHDLAPFKDLLLVVGEEGASAAPALVQHIKSVEGPKDRVASMIRVSKARWDIVFDNGIRLKLPASTDMQASMAAWDYFAALNAEEKILERAVAVIDMRLPDRLTLRLTDEGQVRLKQRGPAT